VRSQFATLRPEGFEPRAASRETIPIPITVLVLETAI
jgi:hypothetical protein